MHSVRFLTASLILAFCVTAPAAVSAVSEQDKSTTNYYSGDTGTYHSRLTEAIAILDVARAQGNYSGEWFDFPSVRTFP
ncbi:hypothetical protein GCM10010401_20730 [Rarobacter faecitabidus]